MTRNGSISVSSQTLAFVARRLLAESVGLVFGVREPSDALELEGLPERKVGGLSDGDARVLLDSVSPERLDEAGAGPDHRRDPWQPARIAGVASAADRRRAGWGFVVPGAQAVGRTHRAELHQASRIVAARRRNSSC